MGMGEYVELCSTERWEEETRELTPEFFTELTDRINPHGLHRPRPGAVVSGAELDRTTRLC